MLFRDRAWCAAQVRVRKRRCLLERLDALSGPRFDVLSHPTIDSLTSYSSYAWAAQYKPIEKRIWFGHEEAVCFQAKTNVNERIV